jgi:hypothetical protein
MCVEQEEEEVEIEEAIGVDELELYHAATMSMKKAERKNLDPLMWWLANEKRFPTVAHMAKNFLGCPASTAGLERMFSALGRNHDDLRKKTLESTLEMRMMIKGSFNLDEFK